MKEFDIPEFEYGEHQNKFEESKNTAIKQIAGKFRITRAFRPS